MTRSALAICRFCQGNAKKTGSRRKIHEKGDFWEKRGHADLEEVQEGRLGQTRLLDQGHGHGEVVDVVAVDVQNHGLGELGEEEKARIVWEFPKKWGGKNTGCPISLILHPSLVGSQEMSGGDSRFLVLPRPPVQLHGLGELGEDGKVGMEWRIPKNGVRKVLGVSHHSDPPSIPGGIPGDAWW